MHKKLSYFIKKQTRRKPNPPGMLFLLEYYVTVTVLNDVLPPLSLIAVIRAVPGATAVTRPELLTVATLESLVDHVTPLIVAPLGLTVTLSWLVSPAASESALLFSVIEVTGRESAATVTLERPIAFPLESNAAILAVPARLPVTTPSSLTVAIDSFDVRHVRLAALIFDGKLAESLSVPPVAAPALARKTLFAGGVVGIVSVGGAAGGGVCEGGGGGGGCCPPGGGTGAGAVGIATITEHVEDLPPLSLLAVIVAFPGAIAVTFPV